MSSIKQSFQLLAVNHFAVKHRRDDNRKGAVAVLAVFMLAGLLALLAVTADYGHITVSRSELKRSSDSAALSGAWELFDGASEGTQQQEMEQDIADAVNLIASNNPIGTDKPTLDAANDIEIGYYDAQYPGPLDTSDPDKFNAVRVHLRKTQGANGEIPLFFGAVTGRTSQAMQTSSTAAMLKSIGGFRTPPSDDETLNILPIALDLETWESVVAKSTSDNYSFHDGDVFSGSDGFYECSLYPTGTGSPGNRGTVDIGGSNNSTNDLKRQILDGISAQDMDDLGQSLEFDANGELELNGDTGLSAGIKSQLAEIIGETRIIPIFTSVHGNGNNATYTIVRFEGVRILDVKLTGPRKKKHLTIQPAPTIARHSIIVEGSVDESDFLFTPVMLVE